MRTRLWLGALLAGTTLALTGCPSPAPGTCNATDDCKGQQDFATSVCVEGKCVECGADADCKAGFVCQAQKCLPKPECTRADDCGTGKSCREGKCQSACVSDGECGTGRCLAGQCKAANACLKTTDCVGNQTCNAGVCTAASTGPNGPCQLKAIPFEFNESGLSDSAQSVLKSDAECLKQRNLSARLEGHADERGTTEYNLQLGEKRAASVKGYLKTLGVDGSKLSTISYGEEQPADQGHDEGAWAANRRVEVKER